MKLMPGKTLSVTVLASVALAACGGGDSGNANNGGATPTPPQACAETGVDTKYACQTGTTEPLYAYQWALKQATSFFAAFGLIANGNTDINVEGAHSIGVKGQGVNVLVLDDGIDVRHEDLAANVNVSMTHNFDDGSDDPTPADTPVNVDAAHGTSVAGIIAAAQNGKGVMGIAPRVTLGGARYIDTDADTTQAYGGADWSKHAHLINASYGGNPPQPTEYDTPTAAQPWVRAFPNLRNGLGLVMLKASGNEYEGVVDRDQSVRTCPSVGNATGMLACENPANDIEALEPGVIVVGAANAKGVRSSYSNAGAVNWVTGLGGEYGDGGKYGEVGSGPVIFSTDLSSCARGYSRASLIDPTSEFNKAGSATNAKENASCNYANMNGTSAATPTVSGVVALMLSANPKLTWRDVREILRATARQIDPDYGARDGRNVQINLTDMSATGDTGAALVDGAHKARLDYGWQRNGAGYSYSTWYGFGLVDATAAVKMAKAYTAYKPAALNVPDFIQAFADVTQLNYGSVQKLGQFNVGGSDRVDALQLRLSGSVCVGSVGIFVKSPSGTVSALALPYNSYYSTGVDTISKYGLGSYAFHGEKAAGTWEVYAVSGVPTAACTSFSPAAGTSTTLAIPLSVEYRVIAAR